MDDTNSSNPVCESDGRHVISGFCLVVLYSVLIGTALLFTFPAYVMVAKSLRPLGEIASGNLISLPINLIGDPWFMEGGMDQIGVPPKSPSHYLFNRYLLIVIAVVISNMVSLINARILTRFKMNAVNFLFAAALFCVFVPSITFFVPIEKSLEINELTENYIWSFFVRIDYGIGFSTLLFLNYYASLTNELVTSPRMGGVNSLGVPVRNLLPDMFFIVVMAVIWQCTNIWNDFLFGSSILDHLMIPLRIVLNKLMIPLNGSESDEHLTNAFIAALSTFIVYMVSGKYLIRGLIAGSRKGLP